MDYIVDQEMKYHQEIIKHLVAYNVTYTGIRPTAKSYLYVLDNDQLVGVLFVNLKWDCVCLKEVFYENYEILKLMLSKISKSYQGRATAIRFNTTLSKRINDFKKLGFEIEGTLENPLKGVKTIAFAFYQFTLDSSLDLKVIVNDEPIIKYEKLIKKWQSEFIKKNPVMVKQEEIEIIALDNKLFAGGVKADIYEDAMYVELLVVNEAYRGQKIGSKLMDLIEEKAKERKLKIVNVETVLAKDFYEKLGYKTVITKKHQPKGFDSYFLVKRLDS